MQIPFDFDLFQWRSVAGEEMRGTLLEVARWSEGCFVVCRYGVLGWLLDWVFDVFAFRYPRHVIMGGDAGREI